MKKEVFTLQKIEFELIKKDKYEAEFAKKNGDFVFHIYLNEKPQIDLDKTFIKVFRDTARIRKMYVEELNCWTYIVKGFADNPFACRV